MISYCSPLIKSSILAQLRHFFFCSSGVVGLIITIGRGFYLLLPDLIIYTSLTGAASAVTSSEWHDSGCWAAGESTPYLEDCLTNILFPLIFCSLTPKPSPIICDEVSPRPCEIPKSVEEVVVFIKLSIVFYSLLLLSL